MYRCPSCKKEYPLEEKIFRCRCGSYLLVESPGVFPLAALETRDLSIWRYREAYGLPPGTEAVSLGEGTTPLVERTMDGERVRFKLDCLLPSGSFKDRGASVLVSLARRIGVRELVEDSSGNAGAAMAAYSTAAGIRCRIFAPDSTPPGKLVQARLCGAQVVRVPGPRQAASDAVLAAAEKSYYASHLWNPFFIQGHMSAAFELWEQLGRSLPPAVVVPLGSGGYLEGIHRGFRLLVSAGYARALPKIYGVQAAVCDPLHRAFQAGLADFVPVEARAGVAEGIAVSRPPRAREVLACLRESGGRSLSVSEEEIIAAHRRLLASGLYVEPTSATALAGLARLSREEREGAVIFLSGHGLKASEKLAALYPA